MNELYWWLIGIGIMNILAYAISYYVSYDSNRRAMSRALGEYFVKRGGRK